MKTKISILCLLFLSLSIRGSAQVYPDAGMWNTFNLDLGIGKDLSAVFTEEFRLKDNFGSINLFYTNIGIEYKMRKFLKLGLIYRNIQKFQEDNSISFRNRLMLDITLKKEWTKCSFSFRTRFQGEVKDLYSDANGNIPEYYMRNKISFKYELNKSFSANTSVEFRYQIYERKSPETDGLYHRARPALGLDYAINKKNSVGAYYLIQYEWNVSEPEKLYILGLEYDLSF